MEHVNEWKNFLYNQLEYDGWSTDPFDVVFDRAGALLLNFPSI